ncbi:hypothetical protein FB451DRAFT_1298104 [Mycena latifolia]|nr:hypothetical protein FB451DRAFT_1298104 [Mycena latifolia]
MKLPVSAKLYCKRSGMPHLERNTAFREVDLEWPSAVIPNGRPFTDPKDAIYRDWYTSPLVKLPWSCNWSRWTGLRWFQDNEIVVDYNLGFNIPGKIEPLAFFEGGGGEAWFFTADGKYYFYHDEQDIVLRFERSFASHDEFFEWEDQDMEHCAWTTEIRRSVPRAPRIPPPIHWS